MNNNDKRVRYDFKSLQKGMKKPNTFTALFFKAYFSKKRKH